jgi:hypothetical protein
MRDLVVCECEGHSRGRRATADLDELIALCVFQAHRSLAALAMPDLPSLEMHREESGAWIAEIVALSRQRAFYWLEFNEAYQLHFPDCGFFMLPVGPKEPLLRAFPITPHLVLFELPILGARPIKTAIATYSGVVERPAELTALSFGFGRLARRVIFPPDFVETMSAAELERHARETREMATKLHAITRADAAGD